jgi:hypothetical protein
MVYHNVISFAELYNKKLQPVIKIERITDFKLRNGDFQWLLRTIFNIAFLILQKFIFYEKLKKYPPCHI